MISKSIIKTLSNKNQTSDNNILREYFQHLFLSYFYQQTNSEYIFFKGGTALRIIFDSPRFSEDLDFSSTHSDKQIIEQIIENTLHSLEKENIKVSLKEATTTTGGYLSIVSFLTDQDPINIQLEISLREGEKKGEIVSIAGDYIPPFTIISLLQGQLIDEKIQALQSRKKPRDFYDLYFILRKNLLPAHKKDVLIKSLQILEATKINFEYELKLFLPKNQWLIIRDFKNMLKREIEKYI